MGEAGGLLGGGRHAGEWPAGGLLLLLAIKGGTQPRALSLADARKKST